MRDNKNLSHFASARLTGFSPYTYGEQPKIVKGLIKLNTNENPYPPHSGISADFSAHTLRYYPDPICTGLRKAAAKVLRINNDNLIFGNGSDEILTLIFRAFFNPSTRVIMTEYTYSAYTSWANIYGIRIVTIPMRNSFTINLDRLPKQKGVFFLSNPNSPTGTAIPRAEIEKAVKKRRDVFFVIDEAYADFAPDNCMELIKKYNNVIIVRTLSKAYSFCGGRLGFACAAPEIIRTLDLIRDSYNVNIFTQHTAESIFRNIGYYRRNIKKIIYTREKFIRRLSELGFTTCASHANFVFTRPPDDSAEKYFFFLRAHNIHVRFFNKPVLCGYLRISIGTDAQMDAVITALQECRSALKSAVKKTTTKNHINKKGSLA